MSARREAVRTVLRTFHWGATDAEAQAVLDAVNAYDALAAADAERADDYTRNDHT